MAGAAFVRVAPHTVPETIKRHDGWPDPRHISTAYEKQHLTIRMATQPLE